QPRSLVFFRCLALADLFQGGPESFRQVGRQRRGGGQLFRQLDGKLISLEVCDAGRAAAQVLLDPLPVLGRQLVGDEIDQQVDQLATGNHGATSSKCGASTSRIIRRARCSRLLTAATLRPSISPISALVKPSTSART